MTAVISASQKVRLLPTTILRGGPPLSIILNISDKMNLSRLLKSTLNLKQLRHFCNNTASEELTVQAFCDIQVDVPYNVKIKPLDVHEYHNCDVLKIELQGLKSNRKTLKHIQDGNSIKIFASLQDCDKDLTCNIEAPVKANLNINARGNISCGVFSGSKLILKSSQGNIFVKKFQGDIFDLNTSKGDIVLKEAIVAANIKAVANLGSIKAKRLQGIESFLKTNDGSITIDSSYCDSGTFETTNGDLNLQNLHKNNKIYLKDGKLNLISLDGQLHADLHDSDAEIQISRILEDSKITLTDGNLRLQLSEECQETTKFEINSQNHTIDPDIKMTCSEKESIVLLVPETNRHKLVQIVCHKGRVDVENSTWMDILKMSIKKD